MIRNDFYENETRKHQQAVNTLMQLIANNLSMRGVKHDWSKFNEEAYPVFAELTSSLRSIEYGSDEYKESLKKGGKAIKNHQKSEAHHPEHFAHGINSMTLMDLIEMICDWYAATLRHETGDIVKSININKTRFNISEQLAQILHNTADRIKRDVDWHHTKSIYPGQENDT